MSERTRISDSTIVDGVCTTVFHFPDGHNEAVTVNPKSFAPALYANLAAYGVSAALKARYQGQTSDPGEAFDLVKRFLATLEDGTWAPGKTYGPKEPNELVLAVERIGLARQKAGQQITLPPREQIEEWLSSHSPAEKRAMRLDPEIAREIANIKIERARETARAAKGKPTTSALGSLFGGPQLRKAEAA